MKTERYSMHRTGTVPVSLPKISKLNVKQSRYNDPHNRSSVQTNSKSYTKHSKSFVQPLPFTARVQRQVIDTEEYPYIETNNIEKQQAKLKDLLKDFNEETVTILQKYVIDKPIRKEYVKKRISVQQIKQIREKQAQNSSNMIMLLKNQIQKLQSRCQNLKYTSKEQFEHRIKQLKDQKQKMIIDNKQLSREITLNGMQIVKGKESLVKQLEYQQFLIDSKRDRLKRQSEAVEKEITSLQYRTREINEQLERYDQEQSFTIRHYEQKQRLKSQNQLYDDFLRKNKILEHNKVINQSTNYQLKHKYFQKLKQLDDYTTKEEDFNKKIQHFDSSIEQAKSSITQLEKKQAQFTERLKPNGQSSYNFKKANISQSLSAKVSINLS